MPASNRQRDYECAEHADLETLERALAGLCEELHDLVATARVLDGLESREARMQLEAFEERRARALECVDGADTEPASLRVGRLRKHLQALECSREFFRSRAGLRAPVAEPSAVTPRAR